MFLQLWTNRSVCMLDFIHFPDEFFQWMILTAPIFKDMHAFVFENRTDEMYGYIHLCKQGFVIGNLFFKGEQPLKTLIGYAENDCPDAQLPFTCAQMLYLGAT